MVNNSMDLAWPHVMGWESDAMRHFYFPDGHGLHYVSWTPNTVKWTTPVREIRSEVNSLRLVRGMAKARGVMPDTWPHWQYYKVA